MSCWRPLSLSLALGVLGGCASQGLVIDPDAATLQRAPDAAPRLKAVVGYFIPETFRTTAVRSDIGSYYPYRDIEFAYRTMLSNVFETVYRVKSLSDTESMRAAGLQYLITPELSARSSSLGLLLGSPTSFTAELTSPVRCPNGLLLINPQVVGHATTDVREAVTDPGAAGRRAMEQALLQMQQALLATKLDPGTTAAACSAEVALSVTP